MLLTVTYFKLLLLLQKWSAKYVQKVGSGSCILRVTEHGQISPDVICTPLKDEGYEHKHYSHLR